MNNNSVLWWRTRNYSGADTRYWQGVGAGVSPHTIMSSLTNSHAIIALNHVLGITAISPSENVLQLIWIWNLTLCNSSFKMAPLTNTTHLCSRILAHKSQPALLAWWPPPPPALLPDKCENRWKAEREKCINKCYMYHNSTSDASQSTWRRRYSRFIITTVMQSAPHWFLSFICHDLVIEYSPHHVANAPSYPLFPLNKANVRNILSNFVF